MTDLQRKALARLPYTEAEAENLYRGVGNATWPPSSGWPALIREILASHERLRAELNGAQTLLAEAEAEAARLAAVAQGRAEQLERVALYLGHVARHGLDGDRTIAGLAIQEFARLGAALAEAEAEIARLRAAAQQVLAHVDDVCDDVEQVLGKALGYPPAYPDASEVDDGRVCVGEHTPATLAREAATEITRLRAALADAPADY